MTVGAPVPAHRELVLAALNAGKHVVTEWPVGTSTAQTEEIAAAAAARSGRHAAVDLQARANPAAMRARELLASDAIGRVLNVTVYSSTTVPDTIGGDLPDSVINVAHVYAGLRNDIASGATDAPGFEDAVRLSHLIDDLIRSDAEQRTVTPSALWS